MSSGTIIIRVPGGRPLSVVEHGVSTYEAELADGQKVLMVFRELSGAQNVTQKRMHAPTIILRFQIELIQSNELSFPERNPFFLSTARG